MTRNDRIAPQGKRALTILSTAWIAGAALNVIAASPLYATATVGTGVLLFNYSDVTANVAETSNPLPYCVNNQGSIPQPMTVGPGSINNPSTDNQDIEFTAQSVGASCRLIYRNELTSDWQYPFNLYFSDGQPSVTYTFGTQPPIDNTNQCAGWELGNLVGIYQGMTCVFEKVNEGFVWFYYLNNTVMVVYPSGASYYYTMTSLAGPSGENVPSGVPPTITGSGNACSAANWNSCVQIQVYNVGEGPYPSGATGTQASASALSMAPATKSGSPKFALPAAFYPEAKDVELAFDASKGHVTLKLKAGSVSQRLIQAYGGDHVTNRLDMLVTVNGKNGLGVNVSRSTAIKVRQPCGILSFPFTFKHDDVLAIRQAIKNKQPLDIGIQIKQHIRTPKETFELPSVTHIKYNDPN